MGKILGWIDSFFAKAYSEEWSIISAPLHWAIRGISALVFGQFQNTTSAWTVYYSDTNYYVTQIEEFITSSKNAHGYTLRVRIPSIVHWATLSLARLLAAIISLGRAIASDVARLTAYIGARIAALTRWILKNIWAPLYALIQKTYADLLKWGYVAWWWITHLHELAEALIFHIALSAENHAWELAGMLGRFAVSLILRNARKIALTVEDVITAVI